LKLVVFGASKVGKSCFIIQMLTGRFLEEYDPTWEDSYRKEVVIENKKFVVEICDTCGRDDMSSSIREKYIEEGDSFLCLYSITDARSFIEAQMIHQSISKIRGKVPVLLIGNKVDLAAQREVPKKIGEGVARSLGCMFFESSTKLGMNTGILQQAIYLMLGHGKERKPRKLFRSLSSRWKGLIEKRTLRI